MGVSTMSETLIKHQTRSLNLGCGIDIRENSWNVDVEPLDGVDEVVDLNQTPWPWRDEEFKIVRAQHILEHLDEPLSVLSEIVRILQDDGWLHLHYPIGHTRFEDPQHKHFWNYHTAEALAGERKHSHEHCQNLRLDKRSLQWNVNSPLWNARVRLRLWLNGPGPWLSQVPGLCGTVKATYRVSKS